MTTAFNPQPIIELKQRDKSKIESVLAFGDRVLVGLNTGSLRVYRVNTPAPATDESTPDGAAEALKTAAARQRPTDLLHEEEKFSKRAIQQLAVIKQANILVTLTDNHVSLHDLQSYALLEKLDKTRGASVFAVTSNVEKDEETGIPSLVSRLAVAVKRKVLLWSWRDMEQDQEMEELALPATVKSLNWITGHKLLIGMDPGFTIANIETGETTDINKPVVAAESAGQTSARFGAVSSSGMGYMGMSGWVPRPLATKLADGQSLVAKDVNTLFIDDDGKPLEKRQIPWLAAPETIGYSYPFLLSLQSVAKGTLEVRSPDTLTLFQSISVPGAISLHVPQPNISLAHAGKGFLVASDRIVWRMLATSYESQTEELVRRTRYDEAISFLNMLEDTLLHDKPGQVREIQIRKAEALFALQKYRPALDLFTDAAAPPARVISLYPKVIRGKAVDGEETMDNNAGDAAAELLNTNGDEYPSSIEGLASPKKSHTDRVRVGTKDSDAVSVKSATADNETQAALPKASELNDPANLKQAVMALCSFLAQSRVQIQRYLGFDGKLKDNTASVVGSNDGNVPFKNLLAFAEDRKDDDPDWEMELRQVAKLVDTTLFRAYMFALPSLAGPLFRLDNFCDPVVVEDKLYETGRYNDLIDFLQGKKLHKQALEMLEKFGQNNAEEEVMPALRGPNRTVGYLQQLPPELIDLILEYSSWPLKTDPGLAMDVFLADSENAESLPRDRVIAHLRGIDPQLAMTYLEHIIEELDDQTPEFHQMLIDMYLETLKSKPSSVNGADTDTCKSKLETFLQKSKVYNKGKVFRQLPSDDAAFFISRALVLSAMGNHKQALSIYVFQVHDYTAAEIYCNNLYLQSSATPDPSFHANDPRPPATDLDRANNIYTTLLSLYLRPPPGESRNWAPALQLLSNHGARLAASSTLGLIPDDLPVAELTSYFRGRMRRDVGTLNEMRIVRGLEDVRRAAIEGKLLLGDQPESGKPGGRNRRVVVREDDHCRVCLRRFGNAAVRVWPDGEVVHYGCAAAERRKMPQRGPGSFEGMRQASWA